MREGRRKNRKWEVSRKKKRLVQRGETGCECKPCLARELRKVTVWMRITVVMIESCLFLA